MLNFINLFSKNILLFCKLIFSKGFLVRFFFPRKENNIMSFLTSQKYTIKKNGKSLFSIRDMGGSTKSRGISFFTKEKITIKWIEKFKNNSTFIDVGANIGIYSLYAATLKNTVVSVEPESLNFALLNLNIFDNNLNKQIKSFPICLSNKESFGYLNINNMNWGKSSHNYSKSLLDHKFAQGTYAITIDKFCATLNIQPNYIKIDVDGNENQVINGMNVEIQKKTLHSILIEVEINKNYSSINNFFNKNNFYKVEEEILGEDHKNIIYERKI